MSGGGLSGDIPADVDRVEEFLLTLVAGGIGPRRRNTAVVLLAENLLASRNGLGEVFAREVDVESDELGDRLRTAVPQVADRLYGGVEVGSWSVKRQRDRTAPTLQQRLQIVQECEVGVCRVRHAFPTPEKCMIHELKLCILAKHTTISKMEKKNIFSFYFILISFSRYTTY